MGKSSCNKNETTDLSFQKHLQTVLKKLNTGFHPASSTFFLEKKGGPSCASLRWAGKNSSAINA
jgi:hypothetical protein